MISEETRCFQGFRFLFILSIAFLHFGIPFMGEGSALCSFFFVLSGFLYNPNNNEEPFRYIKRKCVALFPIYWICLLLYVIIYLILGDYQFKLDFIPHVLLLQSYFPSNDAYFFKYLGVSWFLSSLLFCYVASPVLSKIVQKVNPLFPLIISASCIIILYLYSKGEYRIWVVYISPLFRIWEYFMGVCLRGLIIVKKRKKSSLFIDISVLLGYMCILHFGVLRNMSSFIHLTIIYYIMTHNSIFFNICFGNQYIVYLSKYLIFVYLIHQTVYNALVELGVHNFSLRIIISITIGFLVGIFYFSIRKK